MHLGQRFLVMCRLLCKIYKQKQNTNKNSNDRNNTILQ